MRRFFAGIFSLTLLAAAPAFAVMEDYPSVKLQGLDKSVGRTVTFEAKVGSTIQYGPLYIKIQACRKAPPIEKPESAAFLQIWEVPPGEQKSVWDFSGWMFASSPALSAMDHPVYDIWVLDCTGREEPNEEAAAAQTDEEADQSGLSAAGESTGESVGESAGVAQPPATTGEATDAPANAPTAQEQQEDVPVDSEADMTPDTGAVPQDAPQPLTPDPNAPYSPQAYPSRENPPAAYPQPQGAMDPQQIRPQDPTGDNRTAYDFMNQQGTNAGNAAPAPAASAPAPQSGYPAYDNGAGY